MPSGMHATIKRQGLVATMTALLLCARHGILAAEQGSADRASPRHVTAHNSSTSNSKDDWIHHPAVFTVEQLGLWRTLFHGLVDYSALNASNNSKNKSKSEIKHHKGSHAILLQHWWRCRARSGSGFDLRGVGNVFPAVDPRTADIHVTIPKYMNDHWAAVTLTDTASNKAVNLTQEKPHIGGINAWHVGANGLPGNTSYSLTTASPLSKHSYSWDSSRCSNTPAVFKRGSLWTVIIQAGRVDMSLYAKLVAEHTSYYQAVGFTGAILFISRTSAAELARQPKIQQGLDNGSYVFIVWDEDIAPTMPYFYQYMWYNLVVLATWGVPDIKLAMIDLDEFYFLPKDLTFTKALKPGGCLHGFHQFQIDRYNAFFGVTAAEAQACHEAEKADKAKKAKADTHKKPSNHKQTSGHRRMREAAAAGDAKSYDTFSRCESLKHGILPNVQGLATLGWNTYFQQQQGQLPPNPKQGLELLAKRQEKGQPGSSGGGYIDQHRAAGMRWSRKSFVDSNYVGTYAVHEASYLLPGAKTTSGSVSCECAVGLHITNMFRFRDLGSGAQLAITGSKGLFNLSDHVQHLKPQ